MHDERILAIDIGAGTMDTLVYDPAQPIENAVQLVLPSATSLVGRRIAAIREQHKPVFLHGTLMGGYHTTNAVWAHLQAGLAVYATAAAAGTVHDDLDLLRSRGVVITDDPPKDAVRVEMRDLDLPRLERTLAAYDIALPETIAVAAQDHGFSPKASNRLFRFEHWRRFLTPGSTLADHIWRRPPAYMTRLLAIQRDAPGAFVADTGPVAVLGALEDERVAERAAAGACIVNVGNQHALALLVRGETLFGVMEHHTEAIDTAKLGRLVKRLIAGTVTHDEVFADDGHGALVLGEYAADAPFDFVAVTGPNRRIAKPLGWYEAAPHGAMMLSGCFGLVRGIQRLRERDAPAAPA
ncbi:MAG: DUF1786 domain-containing protein [Chloroflexota bacterium]|nr:DUF1786 domain-containing protein [Chloroflexota bacterium]